MQTTQCLYASKPCDHPRSLKENGELHRLCTFHRIKANDAQRRWHSRQKGVSADAMAASDAPAKTPSKKRRRATRTDVNETSSESDVANVPARRRRRKVATPCTTPTTVTPASVTSPMAAEFTALLNSTPQVYLGNSFKNDPMTDDELALLGDLMFELDEPKLYAPFYPTSVSYESDWWLASQLSSDTTVYCL